MGRNQRFLGRYLRKKKKTKQKRRLLGTISVQRILRETERIRARRLLRLSEGFFTLTFGVVKNTRGNTFEIPTILDCF